MSLVSPTLAAVAVPFDGLPLVGRGPVEVLLPTVATTVSRGDEDPLSVFHRREFALRPRRAALPPGGTMPAGPCTRRKLVETALLRDTGRPVLLSSERAAIVWEVL